MEYSDHCDNVSTAQVNRPKGIIHCWWEGTAGLSKSKRSGTITLTIFNETNQTSFVTHFTSQYNVMSLLPNRFINIFTE